MTELYFVQKLPEPDLVSSVFVFVFDDADRLLFIQEKNGNWDIPGGGRELGETPEQTAAREIAEEAFVTIKDIEWVAVEKLTIQGEKAEGYKRHYPVSYLGYAMARVTATDEFKPNTESVDRAFMALDKATQQDGIIFKNRHIMLDKILARKGLPTSC
jgi:8-oxo-dGTP pyrophosphatase MutT (NUDIX family)